MKNRKILVLLVAFLPLISSSSNLPAQSTEGELSQFPPGIGPDEPFSGLSGGVLSRPLPFAGPLFVPPPFQESSEVMNAAPISTDANAQNEPSIAVNPNNPSNLVVGANDSGTGACRYYYTTNEGATWGSGSFFVSGYSDGTDPSVAFDKSGNVYYACLELNRAANGNPTTNGIFVARSTNSGQTFGAPVTVATGASGSDFNDKPYMAVDTTGGSYNNNVYVSWARFTDQTRIRFSRSTNGGASFSSPISISDVAGGTTYNGRTTSPIPAVGPNGEVYVAWLAQSTIKIDKSLDGGLTFGSDKTVATITLLPSTLSGGGFTANSFPTIDIDRSNGPNRGYVYVAWADNRNGNPDIYFARSTNGGSTWSAPIKVNDDTTTRDQFFPWLSVDPLTGRIHIIFYDRRNDTNNKLIDVYYAQSIDGGLTFQPNVRVTTSSFDPTIGIGAWSSPFIGDYIGIATSDLKTYFAWMDTRNGTQDIYFDTFRVAYRLDGSVNGGRFGYSVANAGDTNGDGGTDVIIGAPCVNCTSSDAGHAYLYSGSSAVLLRQFNGQAANDRFGFSVANTGDVNGDGRPDIIIGAPYTNPNGVTDAGSAYLYSGVNGSLLRQINATVANTYLGVSVAGAGDVNGDGRPDYIIGAPNADPNGLTDAGSAYVYSGATGASLFQFNGQAAGDLFGDAVAGAGDVNGDGRADLIVGAPRADIGASGDVGKAYIFSGINGALLFTLNGETALPNGQFGWSVAGIGDGNGDGRSDVIVGAPFVNVNAVAAGRAYVFSGANGALLYTFTGPPILGAYLGYSVSSAGDVNGDGRADFNIGAPGENSSYTYSGKTGALLFKWKSREVFAGAEGNSVGGGGNVGLSGRPDIIIGGPNYDSTYTDQGRAFVIIW